MIDTPTDTKKVIINKETVKQFKFSRFRRESRASQIKSILHALRTNQHFITPWIVVEIAPGLYEIIDGNHRLEAIIIRIKENPKFEIEVTLQILKDIKHPITQKKVEAMRDIYHRCAIPVKQSTKDYVKAYASVIPMYEPIVNFLASYESSFPFKQVPVHHMLQAYRTASADGRYQGTMLSSPKLLVEDAKKMDFSDLENMTNFYEDLYKMCRLNKWSSGKKPDCFKTTGFSILFHLWYHNKDKMGRAKVVRLFRNKIRDTPMNYLKFIEISRRPGVGASRNGHNELIEILNDSVRLPENMFVFHK